MDEVLPVFIGYDAREHEAYEVCRRSLVRRSSQALYIQKLSMDGLRQSGIYHRPQRANGNGFVDLRDGKPFSTAFAFTRFLVPALMQYDGWALFCDCDFLFLSDIAGLFALSDDRYAAMCVKHQHDPAEASKMNGVEQTRYRRKNWSSLVLWNCGHPANGWLTESAVNFKSGQHLHAFEWLKDSEIGELPVSWNWLSGVSAPLEDRLPDAVHYTLGGPWFSECRDVPLADLWLEEARPGAVTRHNPPLRRHMERVNGKEA